ncbi:hypothetical protein COV93_04045 [Candidatus Woesearchaeota archaeon CG11_big_fil_rev_8_21_14_0_20_43_8]|nr:MAG: hypothetical protein COV93_04045 [Candidatus Woesearchaeota archaeon CG11_big_fil_rev_8_21_14_0_20_43_8]PIO04755.1 MAG: hypothetical protein COT47_07665 [Candidatus Woesearchaeota archaeon CG08_land_8_20_14_0_20_43_7]
MVLVKKGFIAEGTVCDSCEKIVKRQATKVKGVRSVEFDYSTATGYVTFDPKKTDINIILSKIEEKGYSCFILDGSGQKKAPGYLGMIFSIIGILVIGYFLFTLFEGINLPQISLNMGYGLLFIVGLLTGLHCVGMCGGFVVSYTAKDAKEGKKSHMSHIKYGSGKIISYTIIGAAFGLVGSIIAFTPMMRGVAGLLAGLFLVLFGLKMLNIFPSLRRFNIQMPAFITRFTGGVSRKSHGPFIIGLLNGLMIACGPLQAVYIMAAGTGSVLEGAKLLFVFGLGTLPVMLGFGYITSYLSSKFTHKILKASGVIVIVLGVIMMNRGLALTGTGYDLNSIMTTSVATSGLGTTGDASAVTLDAGGYQEIRMEVTRDGWNPDKFVLKNGVPVKWIIDGKEINGCNNAIQVPKFGLKFDIKPGIQTIEFTPTESGTISWSCWMGMIPGVFIVKDNVDLNDAATVQAVIENTPELKGSSCGGSGGSCGCGG